MKVVSALLTAAIVLLLALVLHQHGKITDLEARLLTLAHDRDALQGDVTLLNARIAELQRRPTIISAISSSESPRAQRVEAPQPVALPLPAEPVATPGVTITAPAGWGKNGSKTNAYVVGVDSNVTWGGMPSAYVKSLAGSVDGFGGMMQNTAPDNYAGKRIRLSGWVKTEEANEGGGHIWLRIDGEERGKMLGFDNTSNRAVKGTADWQERSIVLDVPAGAANIAYGFFVKGAGQMWVSGQTITEVGADVPTTNMLTAKSAGPTTTNSSAVKSSAPTTPRNLGFDPNLPR